MVAGAGGVVVVKKSVEEEDGVEVMETRPLNHRPSNSHYRSHILTLSHKILKRL